MAERLLACGADPDFTTDVDGWTALHNAAYRNDLKVTRWLVEHGASVWVQSDLYSSNQTPFDLAIENSASETAEYLFSLMTQSDAELFGAPLHAYAALGRIEDAKRLITSCVEIDLRDRERNTPLFWAAVPQDAALCRLILQRTTHDQQDGSDVSGATPLETVSFLLTSGADVNARNAENVTPLIKSLHWSRTDIATVLIEHGADVNTRDNAEWTPLILAAGATSNLEMIDLLIARGADLHLTRQEWSAVTQASHSGHLAAIQRLVDLGASVNALKPETYSPLHAAAYSNRHLVFDWLLAHGADLEARDHQGRTAFDIAKERELLDAKYFAKE